MSTEISLSCHVHYSTCVGVALADCHTHNNEEAGYNCYWRPSGALNTLIQKYYTTHVCHLVMHVA